MKKGQKTKKKKKEHVYVYEKGNVLFGSNKGCIDENSER